MIHKLTSVRLRAIPLFQLSPSSDKKKKKKKKLVRENLDQRRAKTRGEMAHFPARLLAPNALIVRLLSFFVLSTDQAGKEGLLAPRGAYSILLY